MSKRKPLKVKSSNVGVIKYGVKVYYDDVVIDHLMSRTRDGVMRILDKHPLP